MKTWPTLYDKAQNGKIKFWNVGVFELGTKCAEIRIQHGYNNGKLSTKVKVVDKGKNIGKVNSTTPYEQACFEAKSKWKKKQDKGYVTDIAMAGKNINNLPMLAQTYYQKTHPKVVKGEVKETKLILPVIVNPKLNGVRCIAEKKDWEVKITSKLGKDYSIICRKLTNQLRLVMKNGEIWDGEIYVHGWTFQRIIRAIKKIKPDTRKLQFHRFDMCDVPDMEMQTRENCLMMLPRNKYVRHVPIHVVSNLDVLKTLHDMYVDWGYEGLIIRILTGQYQFGKRVKDLLKYKESTDTEYEIVGFTYDWRQDGGERRKTIKFICITPEGKTFECNPLGSLKQREKWYKRGKTFIGELLTVRFHELSEDGIPTPNPVGVAVRDYE